MSGSSGMARPRRHSHFCWVRRFRSPGSLSFARFICVHRTPPPPRTKRIRMGGAPPGVLGPRRAVVLYVTGAFGGRTPGSAGVRPDVAAKGSAAPVIPTTEWREFTSKEGKFRVMLPGTPTRKERTIPSGPGGHKVRDTVFQLELG